MFKFPRITFGRTAKSPKIQGLGFGMSYMALEDDDDVPEEITLCQGRDDDESARKQQDDNQKRLAAAEKAKRRKRSEQNREAKLEKKRRKEQEVEEDSVPEQEHEQSALASSKVTGFLDESIVQFLAEKERTQASQAVSPSAQKVGDAKPKKKKRKSNLLADGRIKLLTEDETRSQKGSASEFLKKRLYGGNVERSLQMIPQPPARLQSVAYRL